MEVQDLPSPEELTVEKAARRAHLVASAMCETALNALETRNRRMAEDVVEREPSVDRLYFLILRQLTSALQNLSLLKNLGIEAVEAMDYQMLAKSIERIADHTSRIGKMTLKTNLDAVEDEILQALVKVGREANRVNRDAMKAFFTKDVGLANAAITARDKAELELTLLNERLIRRRGEESVNLRIITDSVEAAAPQRRTDRGLRRQHSRDSDRQEPLASSRSLNLDWLGEQLSALRAPSFAPVAHGCFSRMASSAS